MLVVYMHVLWRICYVGIGMYTCGGGPLCVNGYVHTEGKAELLISFLDNHLIILLLFVFEIGSLIESKAHGLGQDG